ncbi:MAG: zf-HC2 domain-containing protein [Desulfobacterales bacterium]
MFFLSAFIDNELPEQKAKEIQEHIQTCETCRKETALIRQIENSMKDLPEIEPSTDFESSFWKKINAIEERKKRWSISNFFFLNYRPYAAATLSALLIAGFVFFYKAHQISKAEEIVIAEHLELLKDFPTITHMEFLEDWEETMHNHEKT